MNRSRLIAITVLLFVIAGGAAARALSRLDPAPASAERSALRNIQTSAELDIADQIRRFSAHASQDEISVIQTMKRAMYIDLLETKQSFARERGDIKTEQEAEAALRFWRGAAQPVVSDSPQPFDKGEGDKKP